MLTPRLAFAFLGTLLIASAPNNQLRVLRHSPAATASPVEEVSVTFDRPVAGSLDRTLDASEIFRIDPAVPGKVEWRDPVTVVFTPEDPLPSNTRFTVRISDRFTAMDGSRLSAPYTFTFRVRGPTPFAGSPVSGAQPALHLPQRPILEVAFSGPVDAAQLAATAYIEMSRACAPNRMVRVRVTGQREVTQEDPWTFRSREWREPERVVGLRRVLSLEPVADLPRDCPGELVLPAEVGTGVPGGYVRWAFRTYGPLRLTEARCDQSESCPTGPIRLTFSTPVRGSEVLRRVRTIPELSFSVADSTRESDVWVLQARLEPRTTYAVTVDTAMRDVFRQPLAGNPAAIVATTGYAPSVSYPFGRLLVERRGFGTLAVQHINVDTLLVTAVPVPDSLEAAFLRRSEWSWGELWDSVAHNAKPQRIPVRSTQDRQIITGVRIPTSAPGSGRTLYAVRITHNRAQRRPQQPHEQSRPTIALIQVTDLAVHARIGAESGVVWVTGVSDGAARRGAAVMIADSRGRVLARGVSDSTGIARFPRLSLGASGADDGDDEDEWSGFEGMVSATLGNDRAVIGVSTWDQDLSAWRFSVRSEWGVRRLEAAGAVFTERGIYRPGEEVHAKAIVRTGMLGALSVPTAGDSLRWTFFGREGESLADTIMRVTRFGTAERRFRIPAEAGLGTYDVALSYHRRGSWVQLARASYRVAEYRPPEFLVDVIGDDAAHHPGDTVSATVQARYLFGAPMARAAVEWRAVQSVLSPWAYEIPNTEGYQIGDMGRWWERGSEVGPRVIASGVDTLDAAGRTTLRVAAESLGDGRASRVAIISTVTDVNRQTVSASAAYTIHPADFYLGVRSAGNQYFWTAGDPQRVEVIAVRPTGERVTGVRVQGILTRREWHQVRRERGGVSEVVGEWVSDTVGRCAASTAREPVSCTFTPPAGGSYHVVFSATDAAGRTATTGMYRWASGAGWVPWSDESRFNMDLIADRQRYSVGDTATIMLASPFTGAEAWFTVEREGLLEQRRMRIENGATTIRIPITEAHVPNAFVSVIVTRGRTAAPGRLDDPGRPTMRVGYTELRVTPEVKRLAVEVQPLAPEYRPGDTARVRLRVRDSRGGGQRAEVALWAVDEGVLALTGYRTPDPLDLIYEARGLGMRLGSNLVSVAPQIPEGEKGSRAPGGGGGDDGGDVLRSQFRTTAFFLGAVETNEQGEVVASAKLPENITTFRVMAVAVTQGDRYGSGQSPMLVTRPLIARPALPRFVRPGDEVYAGTVVNRRAAGTARVDVRASVSGAELRGSDRQRIQLQSGVGQEVRFAFRAQRGDSASFRFDVASGRDADAVRVTLPIRPDFHPRAHTIAGVVRDSATAEFVLPADIDPARSTLALSLGSSPLTIIGAMRAQMRVYPYYCTEQVLSITRPLIAMYRAAGETASGQDRARMRTEIENGLRILTRRQREDGGIGYWSASDWTTPWLSAYAAIVLLDARDAGMAVNDSTLARLGGFLQTSLDQEALTAFTPVARWIERRSVGLGEQVAAVDALSRMGRPHLAAENRLFSAAAQLSWEDRLRLGEVLLRRGATQHALQLIAPAWAQVRIEGRRAVLPDTVGSGEHYFRSTLRPTARLLTATLAASPEHPLVGPLLETLVDGARGSALWYNTQDYASIVEGVLAFRRTVGSGDATVRARAGTRTLLEARQAGGVPGDSLVSLTGMLTRASDGTQRLRVSLDSRGSRALAYYYLTVSEIPRERPVTPKDDGISVERWYERYAGGQATVEAMEGDLVRVRLRITVPRERYFVALNDALPAGLEAVDLSLRTVAPAAGPGGQIQEQPDEEGALSAWGYGRWDSGWWSPFEHREIRDDRVVWFATILWPGTYTATYIARATTPGVFIRPPAHAEEMYNPAVNGRSDGGVFTVHRRGR
jgi:alpha-2-macroglobulin